MMLNVRFATCDDLDEIKTLYDSQRQALGFVLRPSLVESVHKNELLVAWDEKLVGAVHYHHRRDHQTTLYHIAVQENQRRRGIGAALVSALIRECQARQARCILLKCPQELLSNQFYKAMGFQLRGQDIGKHRPLNMWVLPL